MVQEFKLNNKLNYLWSKKSLLFQYIPGHKKSNIILTAPHGGLEDEDSIPLRMAGCKGVKGSKGVSSDGCVYKVLKFKCWIMNFLIRYNTLYIITSLCLKIQ